MPHLAYTKENVEKCWCGSCPVQAGSACATALYAAWQETGELPPPEKLGGMYCSTGTASCTDLDLLKLCNCAACPVWGENALANNHYCESGSAEQTGR